MLLVSCYVGIGTYFNGQIIETGLEHFHFETSQF